MHADRGDDIDFVPEITIHFSNYPTLTSATQTPPNEDHFFGLISRIQEHGTRRVPLELYMGAVKQSSFLRHGHARDVMSLSKADTDQLYEALSTRTLSFISTNMFLLSIKLYLGDFDRFWQVNSRLVDSMTALQSCRSLPLRFYYRQKVIQRLVAPIEKQTSFLFSFMLEV